MKRCLYCGCEISDESVIDFCEKCGKAAFGDKMLKAIKDNMTNAREKGDLNQGLISISDLQDKDLKSDSAKNL